MADRNPRRLCMSHSSCQWGRFCGEGMGHFTSSGEQIWKWTGNEHKLIRKSSMSAEKTRISVILKPYSQHFIINHNYNKILKSDWMLTVLISTLIGQYASCLVCNWTLGTIMRVHLNGFLFTACKKTLACVLIFKSIKTSQILL